MMLPAGTTNISGHVAQSLNTEAVSESRRTGAVSPLGSVLSSIPINTTTRQATIPIRASAQALSVKPRTRGSVGRFIFPSLYGSGSLRKLAAWFSGVRPRSLRASISAPAATNATTTDRSATKCRTVNPFTALTFGSAPAARGERRWAGRSSAGRNGMRPTRTIAAQAPRLEPPNHANHTDSSLAVSASTVRHRSQEGLGARLWAPMALGVTRHIDIGHQVARSQPITTSYSNHEYTTPGSHVRRRP